MALDLTQAGGKVPAVTMLMHGSSFMMRMVDGAGLEMSVILAGDVPAVFGVLRLKRDAVTAGEPDREVGAVDLLNILLCEHGRFLLSLSSRKATLAVVY